MSRRSITVSQLARDAAAKHAANGIGMADIARRIRSGDFDHHEAVQCFAEFERDVRAQLGVPTNAN